MNPLSHSPKGRGEAGHEANVVDDDISASVPSWRDFTTPGSAHAAGMEDQGPLTSGIAVPRWIQLQDQIRI